MTTLAKLSPHVLTQHEMKAINGGQDWCAFLAQCFAHATNAVYNIATWITLEEDKSSLVFTLHEQCCDSFCPLCMGQH